MPPRSEDLKDSITVHHESTPLNHHGRVSFGDHHNDDDSVDPKGNTGCRSQWLFVGAAVLFCGLFLRERHFNSNNNHGPKHIQKPHAVVDDGTRSDDDTVVPPDTTKRPTGPYTLLQCQEGEEFFDYYDFYDGEDSLGSAGYNRYVSDKRAFSLGIANVTREPTLEETTQQTEDVPFVYMSSASTKKGPREAVRLEGRTLFNRGLFILDVRHMPAGCGVWPAFWLTNEEHWPDYGEVDIVEGINNQTLAKTALHTSNQCNMYAHVPDYNRTGVWDRATGIPDTFTGTMDFETSVPADDCWNMAPHQWANQGCVTVSQEEGTIGTPLNEAGGGIYVLEWDPEHRYIRSWVFKRSQTIPTNLEAAIETAHLSEGGRTAPDPQQWGLPYAYFAIGPTTGCSADHFRDMRIVFNLAFCGTVAGNRFGRDCPVEAKQFQSTKQQYDPVGSCNAYIQSQPEDVLSEAYWKIRGVYVYEREMQ